MFLCGECHIKSGCTSLHVFTSMGPCEKCHKFRECVDCRPNRQKDVYQEMSDMSGIPRKDCKVFLYGTFYGSRMPIKVAVDVPAYELRMLQALRIAIACKPFVEEPLWRLRLAGRVARHDARTLRFCLPLHVPEMQDIEVSGSPVSRHTRTVTLNVVSRGKAAFR